MAGRVDRDGLCARQHERREELARVQVEDADVGPRGDVEPVASLEHRPGGARRLFPAWLDRDVGDRRAELARRRDRVVPERDQPAGDRVLGEMRVGVLVDRVRLPVAPVLQELGRRPRVVDLVEVHPRRLAETERPHDERRDDDHADEPQVEPVEPAASLAIEEVRAIEGCATDERARALGRPAESRADREPAGCRHADRPRVGRSAARQVGRHVRRCLPGLAPPPALQSRRPPRVPVGPGTSLPPAGRRRGGRRCSQPRSTSGSRPPAGPRTRRTRSASGRAPGSGRRAR